MAVEAVRVGSVMGRGGGLIVTARPRSSALNSSRSSRLGPMEIKATLKEASVSAVKLSEVFTDRVKGSLAVDLIRRGDGGSHPHLVVRPLLHKTRSLQGLDILEGSPEGESRRSSD